LFLSSILALDEENRASILLANMPLGRAAVEESEQIEKSSLLVQRKYDYILIRGVPFPEKEI
jgi:hypothetical protein